MEKNNFEVIYAQYGDMLYKIAYLYFGSKDEAEDALQEVFIKYIYSAPKFKDKNHEKAWFIRTTQNKCLDMLRASFRKNVAIDNIALSSDESLNDTQLDVTSKIIALPSKYKSTIILYYYYDFSVNEIAKMLKISNSAVKMRLKRGRDILKIELEDYKNEAERNKKKY